jgi:hypothetical protein
MGVCEFSKRMGVKNKFDYKHIDSMHKLLSFATLNLMQINFETI